MNKRNQQGSGLVVLIVILSLAIVGTLGYIFWDKYMNKSVETTPTTSNNETPASEEPKAKCADGDDEKATSGVFCSEEIGIKFAVPTIFKGDLKVAKNYDVTKSSSRSSTDKQSAGKSEKVFEAKITGNDIFTFTIAKEPLRSGFVGVGYMLTDSYYDKDSGILYGPKFKGEPENIVPSFKIDTLKVYNPTQGDANYRDATYFTVINKKIVNIKLIHRPYLGLPADDPSTIDGDKVFKELDKAVRKLTVL